LVRRPGRRPVAGSRRRDDRAVRGRPGDPVRVTLTADPTTPSATASHPPPAPGHAPSRLFSRGVPLPGPRASVMRGLVRWPGPSLCHPTALMGFRSLLALHRFAPAHRWCITFPCDRARVPFVLSRPPRYFSSGWPAAHPDPKDRGEAGRPGTSWRRLPGFAPMCGPLPSLVMTETILPWALPLAGLAGTSCRASGAGTSPPGSPASGDERRSAASRVPLSAPGLGDALPVTSCAPGGSA
jgi:hypothetical protein